jgi:hypothetical protein
MRTYLELLLPVTLASACFLGHDGGAPPPPPGGDDGGVVQPFQADPPSVYVAKVKDVLTGLPPTQDEIDQVANASDAHAALISLIDAWMKTPEYADKMLRFFQLAFQQTQITKTDFAMMIPNNDLGDDNTIASLLVQNASESMARTVLALVSQGQPLTAAMTTHQFMMTPPLMELYALMDWNQPDDDDRPTDQFAQANQSVTLVVEDTTPIALSDTLDPKSPNYMHWYFPGLSTEQKGTGCQTHERDFNVKSPQVHDLIYGTVPNYNIQGVHCAPLTDETNGYLTSADFSAWKMVTVRAPKKGEARTAFWDPNALKNASELVLSTPRVGFFTTPAFTANWQTNSSNSMRVTINQALIVATGMQVDGTDGTQLMQNPPGLDQQHAGSSDCYGCHQYLDPTRTILQATYSDSYGTQGDPNWVGQKGLFAFQGVVDQNIQSVDDLARNLATHPKVASAWVEKLCFYVNSAPCAADDPEFQRIVGVFQQNNFSWTKLVEELLSSPITTNASESQTAKEQGEVVSIARLDHLCSLIDSRLGLVDVCGLDLTKPAKSGVPVLASGLPSDGYGRGAPVPVLPTQPTMFLRAGVENICETIAQTIIDNPKAPQGATTYSSASQKDVDAAIADFVSNLMALESSDPRASQASQLLAAHYQSVRTDAQYPATPTDALRSTFIVACLSPSVLGIGM